MPKHDDYLQSPFYGRAFMACSWDHAMGEFCVNCKDIELAISAAVAEALSLAEQDRTRAVAAEREACAKAAEEYFSATTWAYSENEPYTIGREIADAIRARGGGE